MVDTKRPGRISDEELRERSRRNFVSLKQFDLLKKSKVQGTLSRKLLPKPLWLTNRQARELGFDVAEGEDFLLSPQDPVGGVGRLPVPTLAPELPQVTPEPPEIPQPLEPLLQRLYPEVTVDETLQTLAEMEITEGMSPFDRQRAEQAQDDFLDDIVSRGRTPDTIALLKLAGVSDEEIDEILPPITLERLGKKAWYQVGFWFNQFFKPYGGEDLKGKAAASFIAGIGDVVTISGGAARWLGYENVGNVLSAIGSPLQRVAPPDTSGEFQISDMMDPEFYATKVTRTLPFTLSLLPLAVGGYTVGGGLATVLGLSTIWRAIVGGLAGAALSRPLESALEAGGSYDDAIARGKSEKEAKEEADEVFRNQMLLVGVDAWQIAIALAPTPKWVPSALLKGGLVRTARVGGKVIFVGLSEGGEEVYQDMVVRHARGEEWQLDPISKEVFAIGFVMGAGMGLGGDVLSGVVSKSQDKMSTSLQKSFDDFVLDFKLDGLTTEQAEVKALDEIMQTPEGDKVVREAVEEQKTELPTEEVERVPAPEEAAIEPEVAPVEPVVTPVGVTPEVIGRVLPDTFEGRSIFEMTPQELDAAVEKVALADKNVTRELFGEELGARYDQLQRTANSSNIERAEAASVEIQKLEDTLTEEQQNKLFGIGEVGASAEELANLRDALSVVDIESEQMMGDSLRFIITKLPSHTDVAKMTSAEKEAVAVLRYANKLAQERGFDTAEVASIAIEASARRFSPEDTEFMLRRVRQLASLKLEAPKPPVEPVVTPVGVTPEVVEEPVSIIGEEGVIIGEGGIPVSPDESIPAGVADSNPILQDIGAKEKVRPARKVLTRIGKWRELYKPIQKAEVLFMEELETKKKLVRELRKLAGKDKSRWVLIFREANEKGSQIGLTFEERQVVGRIRKWADNWADRKNLPQEKRIKDYIPHLFEEEITREFKEEAGIDPIMASMLQEESIFRITDPFLKERLGAVGFIEDPFAAMEAYDTVSLRTLHYGPMLDKIDSIMHDPKTPESVALWLKDYSRRMTGELAAFDESMNITIQNFAEKIRGFPKWGEAMHKNLTTGNPSGRAAYNLTSALYVMWLGFKPTSAIRNLSQHTLIIGEVGIEHFGKGIGLRFTEEGKAALAKSLVLRSRQFAFVEGLDSSFQSRFQKEFADRALVLFRGADKQNVSDAFLAGYSEAKTLLPGADEQVWLDRGDEVAADTQYLYTKLNSPSWSQDSRGRVFSMLTTWTVNWMELMTKWISRNPSQVYMEQERLTGTKISQANFATSYKAIGLYMLIVAIAYAVKEHTRIKAFEYVGITSINYLAGVIGGEFPALQYPGAVAMLIAGFLTDDERKMKQGWNQLNPVNMVGILRQLDNVSSGEKDWLTLLFYLEGKDIEITRLRERWEKGFEPYEDLSEPLIRAKEYPTLNRQTTQKRWREENPILEAKMFVVGQFTTLSSEEARQEVLRLIEKHKLDSELIDGYEKVFGTDTVPELNKFQKRIGQLEKLVLGEEAEYFDMGSFAGEVHKAVNIQGKGKVMRDGHPLAVELLNAEDLWKTYFDYEEDGARKLWRQRNPDVEAQLYLWGKIGAFENPDSAKELLSLMEKYNIPPQAINAFQQDPEKYDELFTQKFEIEQKNFDLTTQYENFSNEEAPNFIEDKEERKLARDKFKEDNPDWVADQRRIEAIDNDATPKQIEQWVDRGKTIDEFGAGSSEAKAWLLDNPETHQWALDNKLLTDDGSDWNEEVVRLNVELSGLEEGSEEHAIVKRKIQAHSEGFTQIDAFVEYYQTLVKGFRQERLLVGVFGDEMKTLKGIQPPDYLPPVEYDDLIEKDPDSIGAEEELKIRGWEKKVPLQYVKADGSPIDDYVAFYSLGKPDDYPNISFYEDDFFLMENPEFYKEVYLGTLGNQRADFRLVPPTRIILDKWIDYNRIVNNQAKRDQLRLDNSDLDDWGVSVGIWTRTMSERRRRAGRTPGERTAEEVAERLKEIEEIPEVVPLR